MTTAAGWPRLSTDQASVRGDREILLPIERRDGYWLWLGGPVPPGSSGITLGRLIIIRRHSVSARLLKHELVHVRQFARLGAPRFLVGYVAQYLRWRLRGYPHAGAYRRIPEEIEAYWLERVDNGDAVAEEADAPGS